eukprot:4123122-Lingulodinium_polyedra.AAC.1
MAATLKKILNVWAVRDRIYWLLKTGILKFRSYSAIQRHRRNLRLIILSHVLNFSLCVRETRRIQEKQAKNDPKYSGRQEA